MDGFEASHVWWCKAPSSELTPRRHAAKVSLHDKVWPMPCGEFALLPVGNYTGSPGCGSQERLHEDGNVWTESWKISRCPPRREGRIKKCVQGAAGSGMIEAGYRAVGRVGGCAGNGDKQWPDPEVGRSQNRESYMKFEGAQAFLKGLGSHWELLRAEDDAIGLP